MIHQIHNINSAQRDAERAPAGGAMGVGVRPLGIVTKNSSPDHKKAPEEVLFDSVTGEISTPKDAAKSRAERWALKSVVNRLLPASKTSKCMVLRAPVQGVGLLPIEIRRSREHNKSFYHGLMTCGRVWTCPVCNPKISERRRIELVDALAQARKEQLSVFLVTLTVPHGIGDDVNELLAKLKSGLKVLSSGKYAIKTQFKKTFEIDLAGYVRTLEVTYGRNGFHPHYHILVFVEPRYFQGVRCHTDKSIIDYVFTRAWRRACRLSGLPEPTDEHGVTVEDGSRAAEYVTKWGLEDEMTKTISKQGKRHGLTPWGLLRAILDDDNSVIDPLRAESIFRVYAEAFKNQRQLFWSVGLRKRLLPQNVELSDKELVDQEQDVTSDLMSGITDAQWKLIRRYRKEPDLLTASEMGDRNQGSVSVKVLLDFIMSLPDRCTDAPILKTKKALVSETGGSPLRRVPRTSNADLD